MPSARIDFSQTKFEVVEASTVDDDGGVVIPLNQQIAVTRFRANSEPGVKVQLIWDFGGAAQKVLGSTEGDIDLELDTTNLENQMTGDNVKKLAIVLDNANVLDSGVVGGGWEATKIT